jgi:LysM repeat protein
LSEIAASFGTSVQALMRANPQIEDASLIFPGQELVIPGSLVIIPNTGGRVYVVEQGDTLSEIAVRFNTTVQALLDANPAIQDADLIYTGQSLVIPGTGGS